ncbi:response regulator transcription factor [Streptomyces sp. SID13726]|uniref:response regulator transcription factor n=1 Tax=Streptomyces sp. SID13726 TaxID=2706058 RepID=UPI0013B9831B|nr:response regulator transcription factor [Streptomyces sp. SID13726]NEA99033.1 response regulator transcription factor [Streptomyces sp. SID13726]
MRILLVEDDRGTADAMRRGLTRYGYDVTWAATGRAALAAPEPDLVLLDLGLPDLDGLDVCRELRARGDVPLIMISGRDSETDKVVGLELGADDYLVKPFLMRELVARVRAVQRRRRGELAAGTASEPGVYGRLTVDRRAQRVLLDGAEVALRPKEFALLAFLTDRMGELLPREAIMAAVWDSNWFGSTKTLDVHVSTLRGKFGEVLRIESVRGVGYRTDVGPLPDHPEALV